MMTRKWQNSAARRRAHAKFRAKLCAFVGYPVDCCATTGEVLQDARRKFAHSTDMTIPPHERRQALARLPINRRLIERGELHR